MTKLCNYTIVHKYADFVHAAERQSVKLQNAGILERLNQRIDFSLGRPFCGHVHTLHGEIH